MRLQRSHLQVNGVRLHGDQTMVAPVALQNASG